MNVEEQRSDCTTRAFYATISPLPVNPTIPLWLILASERSNLWVTLSKKLALLIFDEPIELDSVTDTDATAI